MNNDQNRNDPVASVSAIITTYNYGVFIEAAIKSILEQTCPISEIIVVDDGSDDHTRDVIRKYPEIKYYYQEHAGISTARNRAIALAKGDYIAFLDADDLWLPEKTKRQLEYFSTHPNCLAVFADVRNFYDSEEDHHDKECVKLFNAAVRQAIPTALIKKKVFNEIGCFNTALTYGEDTEWLMRFQHATGLNQCETIEDILYLRRIHGKNLSYSHVIGDYRNYYRLASDYFRKQHTKHDRH